MELTVDTQAGDARRRGDALRFLAQHGLSSLETYPVVTIDTRHCWLKGHHVERGWFSIPLVCDPADYGMV